MIYVCMTAYGAETETNALADVRLVTMLTAVNTYIAEQYRRNKQNYSPSPTRKIVFENGIYVRRFESREMDGKMMFVIVKAVELNVRRSDSLILCYHSYTSELIMNFRCPFDVAICSRKSTALKWLNQEIETAENNNFYTVDNFGDITRYPSEELMSYIPYCDVVLRSIQDDFQYTLSVREVKVRISRQRQRAMLYNKKAACSQNSAKVKGTEWSKLPLSDSQNQGIIRSA